MCLPFKLFQRFLLCFFHWNLLFGVDRYLTESLMDEELLSMRNFELYQPLDQSTASQNDDDVTMSLSDSSQSSDVTTPAFIRSHHRMVLDAVTLANLDIFENSQSGSSEGTLLTVLDQCVTPFGMLSE